jgi:hypothetical protein
MIVVVVTMFRMEADVSDRFDAAHFGRALDPARLVIMLARQGHGALAGLLVATMVWRTGSRRNVHGSREFWLTGVCFEHRFRCASGAACMLRPLALHFVQFIERSNQIFEMGWLSFCRRWQNGQEMCFDEGCI